MHFKRAFSSVVKIRLHRIFGPLLDLPRSPLTCLCCVQPLIIVLMEAADPRLHYFCIACRCFPAWTNDVTDVTSMHLGPLLWGPSTDLMIFLILVNSAVTGPIFLCSNLSHWALMLPLPSFHSWTPTTSVRPVPPPTHR